MSDRCDACLLSGPGYCAGRCPTLGWVCEWAADPDPGRRFVAAARAPLPCLPHVGLAAPVPPAAPRPAAYPPRRPDGRLRAGVVCPVLVQGGAERHQLTVARSVDDTRVAWEGCAVLDGPVDPEMRAQTEAVMPVAEGDAAAAELLARCDVVLTWAAPRLTALLKASGSRARVLAVAHAPAESAWGVDLYREYGCAYDRFVAVSELALPTVPACRRGAARVVWNAVDPTRLEPARGRAGVRAAWGVPADAPVAGYLGRFSLEKDPEALVRLARHLPAPWHVVGVGDGWERPALLRRKAELGLDRLHLPGADAAAGDVLGAFDTLLSPSLYESFGLSIAEALWLGVPVVGTPAGLLKLEPGLARGVAVGATGGELAAAVLADAADPAGTRARADAARAFVRDRCGPARFGREFTRELLALGPRPDPGPVAASAVFPAGPPPLPRPGPDLMIAACPYRTPLPGGDALCHARRGPGGGDAETVWRAWCASCMDTLLARPERS